MTGRLMTTWWQRMRALLSSSAVPDRPDAAASRRAVSEVREAVVRNVDASEAHRIFHDRATAAIAELLTQ